MGDRYDDVYGNLVETLLAWTTSPTRIVLLPQYRWPLVVVRLGACFARLCIPVRRRCKRTWDWYSTVHPELTVSQFLTPSRIQTLEGDAGTTTFVNALQPYEDDPWTVSLLQHDASVDYLTIPTTDITDAPRVPPLVAILQHIFADWTSADFDTEQRDRAAYLNDLSAASVEQLARRTRLLAALRVNVNCMSGRTRSATVALAISAVAYWAVYVGRPRIDPTLIDWGDYPRPTGGCPATIDAVEYALVNLLSARRTAKLSREHVSRVSTAVTEFLADRRRWTLRPIPPPPPTATLPSTLSVV